MIDFQIGRTFSLMRQTLPFLFFRFLIYIGITLAYVLGVGIGAGTGHIVDRIADGDGGITIIGGVIGFGVVGWIAYLLREYLLYMVKAGHIAILVEAMDGRALPDGRGQIGHAQTVVRERFGQASMLFGLDQLIKGILKTFNRAFFTISAILPIPGLEGVAKIVNKIINVSLTFLDEVILAYDLRTPDTGTWQSSQDAVILYAQNYKTFLKNAFFLAIMIWVLAFFVFLLALAPAAALVTVLPEAAGGLTVVIALVFAWGLKQAVIEPFGMICLMQAFFRVTEGQEPDPEWQERLDQLSDKFRELRRKASEAIGSGGEMEPSSPKGTDTPSAG